MKKLFVSFVFLLALFQFAHSQPTGPEVIWVCNVGSSSDAKFTQDDKYIVAIDGGDIIVIDAENGKILRRQLVSPNFARRQLKLSKDDSLIYTCGDDGSIYINRFSDLQKAGEITKFKDTSNIQKGINCFDIDENNSIIASTNQAGELNIYNYKKDLLLYNSKAAFWVIKFFDNYQKIAVANSGQVWIYGMNNFKLVASTYPHASGKWVSNFDISPDNTRIVDCGNDGNVYICDVLTGKLIEEIPYFTDGSDILAVKYYKNGTNVIIGGSGIFGKAKLSIYDYINKNIFYKNNGKESILNIENSKNSNKFLIIGGDDNGYNYCLIDGDLITSIIEKVGEKDILIYPNPVDSFLIIDINKTEIEKITYNITNLKGNLITSKTLTPIYLENNKLKIDVYSLQNGIYILTLLI
ncbi:MAG: T9SS type A sorting domain-containing protein, partial [FCB group bacterium]